MATLPNKTALNDLSGGYYAYWTDGITEGRATLSVILGSTDAQAADASFNSLALATPLANDYVAGINQNLLTTSSPTFAALTVGQQIFDTAAGIESNAAGEMSWDADAETVMLALDDQIHMHIGQDSFYHVLNQTGSDIPKGTGVYATGTVGNSGKITVAPFTADGTLNSKYFMGVTAEAIANGATGFVVHFGKLRKINTNAFEEGDILFADPSVAGGLTNVKPAAPNNIITVAIVVTKSATVGELFVRPTFIDGFADNEDVTVTSATTGDLLRYNGTVWVNYPDSNFASATGLSTHIADTTNPHSVTKTQVGLGNVENTSLSTWAGSANITTLGTIGTGVWQGTAIDSAYIDPTLSVTSLTTSGAATVGTTLGVTGAATFSSTVGVTGNTSITGAGAKQLLVGSTNTLGATLILDGSGNGDGAGGDYAFFAHEAGGDLHISNLDGLIEFATGASDIVRLVLTAAGQVQVGGGGLLVNSDITVNTGSITSASGAISFGNENLSTTGTLAVGNTVDQGATLNLSNAGAEGIEFRPSSGQVLFYNRSLSQYAPSDFRASAHVFRVGTTSAYEITASGNHDFKAGSITTTGTLASGAATVNGGATSIGLTLTGGLLTTSNDYAWFRKNGNTSGRTHRVQTLFQRSDGTVIARHGTDISGADTETYQILVGTGSTPQYTFTSSGATVTGTLGVTGDVEIGSGSGVTPAPAGENLLVHGSGNAGITIGSGATSKGVLHFGDSATAFAGLIEYSHSTNAMSIGTAGVTALTLDSSQNATFAGTIRAQGLSPSSYAFNGDLGLAVGNVAGNGTISIVSGSTGIGYLAFADGTTGTDRYDGRIDYNHSDRRLNLWAGALLGMYLDSSQNATFAGNVSTTNGTGYFLTTGGSTTPALKVYMSGHSSDITSWSAAAGIQLASYQTDAGSPYTKTSSIIANSDGTVPSELHLWTKTNGNASPTIALTLDSSQNATFAGDVTLSAGDLTVSGSTVLGSASALGRLYVTDGDMYLGDESNDSRRFYLRRNGVNIGGITADANVFSLFGGSASANHLTIDTSGNVLLGSTSTSNNAQFYATKTYTSASGNDHHVSVKTIQSAATTGGIQNRFQVDLSNSSGTVGYGIGILSQVNLNATGGTTTDAYALYADVRNSNALATLTNGYGVYIAAFSATGTITNRWGIYQAGASENNYLAGDLRIGTTSATSHGTESLRIQGVSRALNVHRGDSNEVYAQFTNTTTGTASTSGLIVGIDGGEEGYLWNYTNAGIYVGTNATTRLYIPADAYALGIGTTDVESWGSGFAAIEFNGSALMGSSAGWWLLENAYYDGSWKYKALGEATRMDSQGGIVKWETAASGSADAALSWSEKMRLTNDGMLLVGDTANTGMTVGLTINQGANDDEILAFKSSDVAHGMTARAETDTFGWIRKASPTAGGMLLYGASEGQFALNLFGYVTTENTTKTTAAVSPITVQSQVKSGSGSTTHGANANIFGVSDSSAMKFIVDADGDYHYDGADGGAFDAYQDAHLVRAFANATSKETVRTAHDDWVQYNEQTLVDIGVLGAPVSEGGLINGAQLQRVHTGAIWQNYMAISDTKDEVETLRARLDIAETKLAIAESKLKQLPAA